MHSVRIVDMPPCRVVLSQPGMFGDGNLEKFDEWFSKFPRDIWPKDFLYFENGMFRWAYVYSDGMEVPEEFEIAQWAGGLYAVATDVDGQTDKAAMDKDVRAFVEKCGLEIDTLRPELGNVITSGEAAEIMGFCQMDYWYPVKRMAHNG